MQNTGSVNSKERPILFNAEMVNAILSGRKTQTRRIMGNQPAGQDLETVHVRHNDDFNFQWYGNLGESSYFPCPLGKPGDQLWVRETFALLGNEDGVCVDWQDNMVKGDEQAAARIYKASCEQKHGDYGLYSIPDSAYWKPNTSNMKYEGSWRPSIHMPRWASRINLLITGVRVERLNTISTGDAMAEGYPAEREATGGSLDAWLWFRDLWDGIYPDNTFEVNPWCWVIEFERMEAK
ncbi:hypothetical protein [Yersinia enterocolitica]|uniref:hypothetical protein n=1 Tax=Yersinia enterocolitica TaxID=630 RepID=UPI001C610759|nr:hypothetical protein [Yersinia enterocolitica]MBW5857532.1 hypothetical protein [Yersinia enterocolitica]MBW5861817.1 hypothetical protein [Yersinia enterocolitica]